MDHPRHFSIFIFSPKCANFLLNRPDLPQDERIILHHLLDLPNGVNDGGVIPARKPFPKLRKTHPEILLRKAHGNLSWHENLPQARGTGDILNGNRVVRTHTLQEILELERSLGGGFEPDEFLPYFSMRIARKLTEDFCNGVHSGDSLLEFVLCDCLHQNPLQASDAICDLLCDAREHFLIEENFVLARSLLQDSNTRLVIRECDIRDHAAFEP